MESSHPSSNSADAMYLALEELCINNQEYFKKFTDDENSQRLYLGFCVIIDHIKVLVPMLNEFRQIVEYYDYDNIPANGFRSFLMITDIFVVVCVKICKEICLNRGSLFFKKSRYAKDVEVSSQVFASLVSCFELLKFLKSSASPPENLLLQDTDKIKESLTYIDKINLYCFFGRFVGFQFCDSVKPIVRTISIMMAAFAAVYYGDNSSILSWTNSCKNMLMDPEARANQIVKISLYRTSSVNFCKAFWNLSELELFKMGSNFFTSNAVNKPFSITLEPIQCINLDGSIIDIPVPSSHLDDKCIHVRLISSKKRRGMDLDGKDAVEPASKYIVVHCHGGGFVAQTSGSHQSYLKDWSSWIDAPIISIDYSLAPEAPFPRALEEVLYVYAWVLNNASTLGTTAEKIVFAGDSAGANLCLSLAMKCINMNIRIPDGVFLAYLPVVVSIIPTPARMLCLLDPLMPFGFMVSCLKAYTRSTFKNTTICEKPENTNISPEKFEEIADIPCNAASSNGANIVSIVEGNKENVVHVENPDQIEEDKVLFDVNDSSSEEATLPVKFKNATENFIKTINQKMNKLTTSNIIWRNNNDPIKCNDDMKPIEQFIDEVPPDMYLSPYLASDEFLKQLPPISLLSVQLDPCLDDCVMLAKKLNKVGNKLTFDVLNGLPHGFLNLSAMSKEARDGSKLCAQRIKELLERKN